MRASQRMTVLLLVAGAAAAACQEDTPTSTTASRAAAAGGAPAAAVVQPLAIANEMLTLPQRHEFTDDVAVQVRLKPSGRPREVINIRDASRMAVVRFTVQPGVRFPWHSHPGLVMVAVTQGELVFVYGDDCVQRRYPAGTAFIDPGFGNVHYAFNPTGGELEIIATFLGVPEPPVGLTNAVPQAQSDVLDAKCGAVAASAHGGH